MLKSGLNPFLSLRPWSAAIAAVVSFAVQAGPERGSGAANFPEIRLEKISRGAEAVKFLGDKLQPLAEAYGWQRMDLETLLLADPDLAVDQEGRLLYTDPIPEAAAGAVSSGPVSSIPSADAFTLHSRPGASRTVYLDFNGHLITGTAWNTSYNAGADIVAPPFDLDGAPTTFSTAERNVIIETWLRVAEDFAPFDVDVTTELTSEDLLTRASSADSVFGTRILISAISQYFGSYGGLAYVGAFDDVGNTYKPALVFPENLGNSAKNIAEAAAHECGHNLGLSHDGTATVAYYSGHGSGETGWAPIMGVGYYQNLSQWSRGEYPGANNQQDDLAVISTYGLPLRTDDHGNTAASATPLAGTASLSGSGVIERAVDVDVHSFTVTATSAVTLNVVPAAVGPNLDLLAELRDGAGTLLGTSNPSAALSSAFTGTLAPSTYYLSVGGAGLGDPLGTGYTDYGSLGQYTISGTVSAPNQAPVAAVTATPTSGTIPLAVAFSGAGSTDADGSISSYAWNFGDGTTGTGVSINKTYSTAGNFTAVLTVKDNLGATGTASKLITASAATKGLRVKSIALTKTLLKGKYTVKATVTVTDLNGALVPSATVAGSFSGAVSGSASGTTSSKGVATLTSAAFVTNGSVTFSVTALSKSGYTYDASKNLATSTSLP